MATKDLIKKLSKPQKPEQLVHPERISVKVVPLEDNESVQDRVEKEMTELSKEELFQQQLQVQEKRVKRLFEHYEELRNAMEVILEDNQGLISHCEALEERIAHLEKPWYKKLFRRKAKKCQ